MKTSRSHVLPFAGLAALFLYAATFAPAAAQSYCALPPHSGKSPLSFRGAIRLGAAHAGDPFGCGGRGAPAPASCRLSNRIYTDKESSCVNTEVQFNGDYRPAAFGGGQAGAGLFNYESDIFVPANWPGDFGMEGERWFLLWDFLSNPGSADCAGYYAAQSDILVGGEFGRHLARPCSCTMGDGGCLPGACVDPVVPADAARCNPQTGTPVGQLAPIGALAPVPVPVVRSFRGDSFADPSMRIEIGWRPACAATAHDGAPHPVMGYRLELYADADGDRRPDAPTVCDPGGGRFLPLLDLAPLPKGDDAIPDRNGGPDTAAVTLTAADFAVPGVPPLATIEAMTFRLRILFQDDRNGPVGVGGRDGVIHPVASMPSMRSLPLPGCLDCEENEDGDEDEEAGETDVDPDAGDAEYDSEEENEDFDADGFTIADGDCDDDDADVHPDADEVPGNAVDENCDGAADDADDDGFTVDDGDCDDDDADVHPDAGEICDGIDNDCDGSSDEPAEADAWCDDGDPCTIDRCGPDGTCAGEITVVVGATCEIEPATLGRPSKQTSFSIRTVLSDICTGEFLDPDRLEPVHISGLRYTGQPDREVSPPRALPDCDDERDDGLWETTVEREVTGNGTARLLFSTPSDGRCATRDGDRRDLLPMLLEAGDAERIKVCYGGRFPGAAEPFECCAPVTVKR